MRRLILACCAALPACAATYSRPDIPNQSASAIVQKPAAEVLAAARRTLVADGFQITAFDDSSGIVSTAPRNMHVTPEQVNCGTTLGIDYLKDNRTTTRVAYGVLLQDNRLEVRATIEGEYKPGDVTQNVTLTCVSRGVLDQTMLTEIMSRL